MALQQTDVNLLPEQVKKERKTTKVFHKVTLVSVVIFSLLLLLSLGIFLYSSNLQSNEKKLDSQIKKELTKLESFSFIEELAQKISVRSTQLNQILSTRSNYSILLREISNITPPQISIETLTSDSARKVTISGEAQGYIDLAKFLEAVANSSKEGGKFSSVTLNSVSLDRQTGVAKFSLSIFLEKGALTQK